jgi:hypothetical protein
VSYHDSDSGRAKRLYHDLSSNGMAQVPALISTHQNYLFCSDNQQITPRENQQITPQESGGSAVWAKIGLQNAAEQEDTCIWTVHTAPHLNASFWPFVLLTLIWWIWDVRNDKIFRNEPSTSRRVLTLVYDDLVIRQKHLRTNLETSNLRQWCVFLLSCNSFLDSMF